MKFNKLVWLTPIIFFQLYLSFTVLIFLFGPWPWDVENSVSLYSYLLSAQISILIGYLLSWPGLKKYNSESFKEKNNQSFSRINFFNKCIIINIILLIPTSLSRTGNFFPDIYNGIINPGLAYNLNYERLQNGNIYQFVEYLRLILSFFLVSFFPLAISYWGLLTRKKKLITLFIIFFNLSIFISTGVNKGLADFVLTTPWLIFLAINSGTLKIGLKFRKVVFWFLILLVLFILFFALGQLQREGGVGELGVFNTGGNLIYADRDTGLSQYLPYVVMVGYESITRYLSQGYYALSLMLELNHPLTWGLGGSMFLARNADSFFSTNFFSTQSLPALLEEQSGWGMFSLWHSIYPWLISDFGLIGSLLMLMLFSYLLGKAWGKSICTLDPLWVTIFFLMLVLFFYIPANNQIFQTGETTCGFISALLFLLVRNMHIRSRS